MLAEACADVADPVAEAVAEVLVYPTAQEKFVDLMDVVELAHQDVLLVRIVMLSVNVLYLLALVVGNQSLYLRLDV
jgi:hypothetical protein